MAALARGPLRLLRRGSLQVATRLHASEPTCRRVAPALVVRSGELALVFVVGVYSLPGHVYNIVPIGPLSKQVVYRDMPDGCPGLMIEIDSRILFR